MIKVGVTGGIGSGKSCVCALLARRGIPVYDTDSRARELMNSDTEIRKTVTALLGPDAYKGGRGSEDGELDRAYVASRVFDDKTMLASLNSIVHPVVARDFETWARSHSDFPYVVMESAILFESGFYKFVDKTVTVSAPREERMRRVALRDGSGRRLVAERMANQLTDKERETRADYIVSNTGSLGDLEVKIDELDKILRL